MSNDVDKKYQVEFLPATIKGGGPVATYVVYEVKTVNGIETKIQLPGGSAYPTQKEARKALEEFLANQR